MDLDEDSPMPPSRQAPMPPPEVASVLTADFLPPQPPPPRNKDVDQSQRRTDAPHHPSEAVDNSATMVPLIWRQMIEFSQIDGGLKAMEIFRSIDKDRSGKFSIDSLAEVLRHEGVQGATPTVVAAATIAHSHSGFIDYKELMFALRRSSRSTTSEPSASSSHAVGSSFPSSDPMPEAAAADPLNSAIAASSSASPALQVDGPSLDNEAPNACEAATAPKALPVSAVATVAQPTNESAPAMSAELPIEPPALGSTVLLNAPASFSNEVSTTAGESTADGDPTPATLDEISSPSVIAALTRANEAVDGSAIDSTARAKAGEVGQGAMNTAQLESSDDGGRQRAPSEEQLLQRFQLLSPEDAVASNTGNAAPLGDARSTMLAQQAPLAGLHAPATPARVPSLMTTSVDGPLALIVDGSPDSPRSAASTSNSPRNAAAAAQSSLKEAPVMQPLSSKMSQPNEAPATNLAGGHFESGGGAVAANAAVATEIMDLGDVSLEFQALRLHGAGGGSSHDNGGGGNASLVSGLTSGGGGSERRFPVRRQSKPGGPTNLLRKAAAAKAEAERRASVIRAEREREFAASHPFKPSIPANHRSSSARRSGAPRSPSRAAAAGPSIDKASAGAVPPPREATSVEHASGATSTADPNPAASAVAEESFAATAAATVPPLLVATSGDFSTAHMSAAADGGSNNNNMSSSSANRSEEGTGEGVKTYALKTGRRRARAVEGSDAWQGSEVEASRELTFAPAVHASVQRLDHMGEAVQAYVSENVFNRLSRGASPRVLRADTSVRQKQTPRSESLDPPPRATRRAQNAARAGETPSIRRGSHAAPSSAAAAAAAACSSVHRSHQARDFLRGTAATVDSSSLDGSLDRPHQFFASSLDRAAGTSTNTKGNHSKRSGDESPGRRPAEASAPSSAEVSRDGSMGGSSEKGDRVVKETLSEHRDLFAALFGNNDDKQNDGNRATSDDIAAFAVTSRAAHNGATAIGGDDNSSREPANELTNLAAFLEAGGLGDLAPRLTALGVDSVESLLNPARWLPDAELASNDATDGAAAAASGPATEEEEGKEEKGSATMAAQRASSENGEGAAGDEDAEDLTARAAAFQAARQAKLAKQSGAEVPKPPQPTSSTEAESANAAASAVAPGPLVRSLGLEGEARKRFEKWVAAAALTTQGVATASAEELGLTGSRGTGKDGNNNSSQGHSSQGNHTPATDARVAGLLEWAYAPDLAKSPPTSQSGDLSAGLPGSGVKAVPSPGRPVRGRQLASGGRGSGQQPSSSRQGPGHTQRQGGVRAANSSSVDRPSEKAWAAAAFSSFMQRQEQCKRRAEEKRRRLEEVTKPKFQPTLVTNHRSRSASPMRSSQRAKATASTPNTRDPAAEATDGAAHDSFSTPVSSSNTTSRSRSSSTNSRTRRSSSGFSGPASEKAALTFGDFMNDSSRSQGLAAAAVGAPGNSAARNRSKGGTPDFGNGLSSSPPVSSSDHPGEPWNPAVAGHGGYSLSSNAAGAHPGLPRSVFERLGVYEVLRRREAAKLVAARRRGGANHGSEAQRSQVAYKGPGSGGNSDAALYADPDTCSFKPDITEKGRLAPPRSAAAMCADAQVQVSNRRALTLRTEQDTLADATFTPTLAAANSKAAAKVAAQGGGTLRIMAAEDAGLSPGHKSRNGNTSSAVVSVGGSYIERLRAKAAAQDAARQTELAKRSEADVASCTFAPDLSACPDFILRLADGFRTVNSHAKQRKALYGHHSQTPHESSSSSKGGMVSGLQPQWQTVSAAEGTVFGARWHGVVVTDPDLQRKRMPRSVSTGGSQMGSPQSDGLSSCRSISSYGHGAFA